MRVLLYWLQWICLNDKRKSEQYPIHSLSIERTVDYSRASIMANRRASLRPSHLGHTDDRFGTGTNGGSSPSSKLLQDLLREKKAQSQKVEKAHNPNSQRGLGRSNSLGVREVQSSPIAPPANREFSATHGRRSSHFGRNDSLTPKEWGMREIDEVSNTGLACEIWLANF